MTISRDEVERARLMSEFKYEIDTQSKIGYARKEGRKEGREEGRKEGAIRIVDLIKDGKTPEEALKVLGFMDDR
jgi:predicted transposase YdaD